MQRRMDIIVGFLLLQYNTQNGYFMGQHFDHAACIISECAGVGVPRGHCWEVRQCGCNVVPGRRMGREEKGQNLKNVSPQNPGGG